MKTLEIPVLNPVNGGTPVPGDWKAFAAATVREITEVKDAPPFAKHVAIPVDGNSLKHMGIHHGDVLICRKTRLYQPGVIGIWETPHGRTAKYASLNGDGSVTLHNHNGWKQQWSADECSLYAIAVRVEADAIVWIDPRVRCHEQLTFVVKLHRHHSQVIKIVSVHAG